MTARHCQRVTFQPANIPFFFDLQPILEHQNAFYVFFYFFRPLISRFFVIFEVSFIPLQQNMLLKQSKYSLRTLLKGLFCIAGALLMYSCASIGNPSGGPRDEDPPVFVRSNPAPDAVGVSRNTITLDFNELVNVKDAFSKVIVSPPSKQTPRVSSNGRRVTITFPDTLLPNTTYTIDFMDAIEDVNEGNKLEGFTYSFSTGPVLDSLRISGMVLNAADLEPEKDVIVGVHSILADSVFTKLPFERISKTDDRGRFIIRGLKPGPYRIFALKDMNSDYVWDNPEESIAFYDEIVVPQTEQIMVSDTIYNLKTMEIDTVVERSRTLFLPNNLLLPLFNINFKQQYTLTTERPDSAKIKIILNAKSPTLPSLSLLDKNFDDWYDLERSINNDTLTFWLRDKALIQTDTLRMRLDYDKVLRSGEIEKASDTISLVKPKISAIKAKLKSKKEQNDTAKVAPKMLDINFTSSGATAKSAPLRFEASEPLESLFGGALHLERKVDSIWTPLPDFDGVPLNDSLNPRAYTIPYNWDYGTEYRLRIDSLAATGIYGHSNREIAYSFKVKPKDEYSSLKLKITGIPDSIPAFVQLLNSSDTPVRKSSVTDGIADFIDINPGIYYARLILDANDNGIFDTGNYDKLLQPEIVCYYPGKLNLRRNWEIDQTWNLDETPVDLQKPDAIKKNKPASDIRKKKNSTEESDEEEDDGYFDPTVNPFDQRSVQRSRDRRNNTRTY